MKAEAVATVICATIAAFGYVLIIWPNALLARLAGVWLAVVFSIAASVVLTFLCQEIRAAWTERRILAGRADVRKLVKR